jgi:hypothetical protein
MDLGSLNLPAVCGLADCGLADQALRLRQGDRRRCLESVGADELAASRSRV